MQNSWKRDIQNYLIFVSLDIPLGLDIHSFFISMSNASIMSLNYLLFNLITYLQKSFITHIQKLTADRVRDKQILNNVTNGNKGNNRINE